MVSLHFDGTCNHSLDVSMSGIFGPVLSGEASWLEHPLSSDHVLQCRWLQWSVASGEVDGDSGGSSAQTMARFIGTMRF